MANLTTDMVDALRDLHKHSPVWRGPSYTGLTKRTYEALERRGLVRPTSVSERFWMITDAGRAALGAVR